MKNPEVKTNGQTGTGDILDMIEDFLKKNSLTFMIICLAVASLFCYLLFDARMSFATDDSEYVKMAYNLLYHGSWPTYHGTLYPVMLSGLYAVFGLKVVTFKFFSAIYLVASVFFFYRAFKDRVPYLVLFTVMIYVSVNSYFLYFSSQTFSEAFTMFIQSVSFIFFFRLIQLLQTNAALAQSWKQWLMFGFCMLVLSVAKNILIIALGGAVMYFLIYKEWKNAAMAVASFLVFKIPYEFVIRRFLNGETTAQFEQMKRVDFYDPSKGYEEFPGGYLNRFFENFDAFVSGQIFKVMGFRAEHADTQTGEAEPSTILSLIFAGLLIWVFIKVYKNNRYMTFSLLFALAVLFASFAALQTIWNVQWRLVVPYIPYLLLPVFGAFWYQAKTGKQAFLKPVLAVICIIFLLIQLPHTFNKVSANSKGLKHYVAGDMQYGIPDPKDGISEKWGPFIQICDSISAKVPATGKVATGNPGEAFVYSKFPNVERISVSGKEPADTLLAHLKKQGITHLFYDGSSATGKALQILQKTYPQKLVPVMQASLSSDQSLYLIELKY